jgi:chromosome partitioning protein
MRQKIISILSSKGGGGKTTIATNIACGLSLMGYSVVIADTDPQRSSLNWALWGKNVFPVFEVGDSTKIRNLKNNPALMEYEIIVLDGKGVLDNITSASIKVSDIIIIPVIPGPHDISAINQLSEMINDVKSVDQEVTFLVSNAIPNTKLSKSIEEQLSVFGYDILSSRTTKRVLYITSQDIGDSVFSEPGSQAALEMDAIVKEIKEKYL